MNKCFHEDSQITLKVSTNVCSPLGKTFIKSYICSLTAILNRKPVICRNKRIIKEMKAKYVSEVPSVQPLNVFVFSSLLKNENPQHALKIKNMHFHVLVSKELNYISNTYQILFMNNVWILTEF